MKKLCTFTHYLQVLLKNEGLVEDPLNKDVSQIIHTVEPYYYGHPRYWAKVTLMERRPYYKGLFALRNTIWD